MIKNKSTLFKIILLILIFSSYSFAEDTNVDSSKIADKFIQEQLSSLNIRELELVLEDIVKGSEVDFPKINVKETILAMIKGEKALNIKTISSGVSKLLFKEVYGNLALVSQILIITIACSILTNLQTTFEKDTVAQLAHYACYIILSMLIINSFTQALDLGRKAVVQMVGFMQIILPILLTLLTAVGGPNTKLLFHPIVIGTVNIIGTLVKDFIFPLILFSFIIGIISNISYKIQFSKLTELIRQIIIVVVSASLTVFIGIITMYGLSAKIDGVTIRTAKFAVDNFIPIIGKFLSDAVETVVGCSAILKNGIGMIGLMSLLLICITPAIKIVVLLFVYKGIAALIQPIASTSITNCFTEVGKALLLILVGILSVATMFFITITIIVEAGNATLMFR
jgi:stage III sporulation protein AE